MPSDPEAWELIFHKITEAIQLLENFQGAGLSYNPSPEMVERTIELLQETRLLIPVQGQIQRTRKKKVD